VNGEGRALLPPRVGSGATRAVARTLVPSAVLRRRDRWTTAAPLIVIELPLAVGVRGLDGGADEEARRAYGREPLTATGSLLDRYA
jgi:hypothetical protein